MKTVGVTDYTNQTPPKHFGWKKMSKFNTRKKGENIYQMSKKWEVHIFNVLTIIMESLNIKEMKTVGVTGYQAPLHISDGTNDYVQPPKK